MACNSCAKNFSLLRKEKGCPGCGFSYCSKCLDNKIFLPKLNAEAKVCSKCKKTASNPNETKSVVCQPPDAYYKRLSLMADEQAVNKTTENKPATKDDQILARLKMLKEDKKITPTTTTDEDIKNRLNNIKGVVPSTSNAKIEERLAQLRGVPMETISNKAVLLPPDTRTEQQQADDLLKQYMEVTSIDSKYKDEFDGLISNMELRMQKLKGSDSAGAQGQVAEKLEKNVESEDEEESVNRIVEKIKAEASLESNEISPMTHDELPFCEICNEDATMRCLGCKYLFCRRCFLDHKDDDDGCNQYETYHAPNSQYS